MNREKGIVIPNEEQDKKLFTLINKGNKTFNIVFTNNNKVKTSLTLRSLSFISKQADYSLVEYLYISYTDNHKGTNHNKEFNKNNPHDNIINTSELNKSLSNIIIDKSMEHNQEEGNNYEESDDISLSTSYKQKYSSLTIKLFSIIDTVLIIWEIFHIISLILSLNFIIHFALLYTSTHIFVSIYGLNIIGISALLMYSNLLAIFYFIIDKPNLIIKKNVRCLLSLSFIMLVLVYPIKKYFCNEIISSFLNQNCYYLFIDLMLVVITFTLIIVDSEMENIYEYQKEYMKTGKGHEDEYVQLIDHNI